ncbi:SLCO4A [Mytilus coruscus]|uniref:SLCO4A n=1 Tax=Mytilus coruscus TaxID=42192 RepID=A0A6J8AMD1_MYTCO|nr:SLCO4A [Mytilus coruscus]
MVANQNEDRRYGCGPIKFSCIQRLNSIRWHVFWQCIFNFFEGFIVSGVVNVIIPALEKRYELSSSKSAIIVSANDFGAFVLLIFIGYFGERRHKPKLMGSGILLMAFGCLVFSLPQFIGEKSKCQDLGACGALLYLKMSDCQDLGVCGTLLYLKMSDCQDLGACGKLLYLKMSACQDLGACGALLFLKMSDCQDLGACGIIVSQDE